MSKDQREKAGFRRITAYCLAEAFKMKLLASFLKREHNVKPRVYDEAMYVVSALPCMSRISLVISMVSMWYSDKSGPQDLAGN